MTENAQNVRDGGGRRRSKDVQHANDGERGRVVTSIFRYVRLEGRAQLCAWTILPRLGYTGAGHPPGPTTLAPSSALVQALRL